MRREQTVIAGALMAICGQVPADLPNVVMIMADDWGWSDIAAYRRFQGLEDPIPTPNLDRLVANGMMFTDAHSPAALCAPTRFSMMTGSNPYRNGMQWGTWGFTAECAFSNGRKHVTVGEIAQTAGYRTSFFGKMHFGGGSTDYETVMPEFPTTYGFDYTFCSHGGIQDPPYLYFEKDRFVKIDPANPLVPSLPGMTSNLVEWASGSYAVANGTGVIQVDHAGTGDAYWNSSQNGIINSKKAAAFIADHVANYPDRPFMMYYCAPQVHLPHTPPIDFNPNADGTPHASGDPDFVPVDGLTGGAEVADMVHELDLQVGRIINRLEDPDGDGDFSDSILADTLVMFTSDNGGLATDRGLADYDSTGVLRGWKASSYEGGHRVPFVASWPGHIATNSVSEQLICSLDWVGLMYALTTNSMAADQAMDCVNILPILLGEHPEDEPVHDFLILQGHNVSKSENSFIMRQGDYVLLMDDNRDPVELYNLANDFSQETNLIAEASEQTRITEMEALFKQYDEQDEPRSTEAYVAPDVYPPLPNPAGFSTAPSSVEGASVFMTAETGADSSGPVEYRFVELSGHEGGSSSDWQLSPDYTDSGLLPGLTYSYSVQMRDALGHVGTVSETVDVTTGANRALLFETFETTTDAGDIASAPYPVETWHHQVSGAWAKDDSSTDTSVEVGNYGTLPGNEMRIGWGFDEVVTLYSTTSAIDTNRTYYLSGKWEMDSDPFLPLGFVAGLAEFSAANGSLVQRLTPDSLVFGDTNSPALGDTGTFSVSLSPEDMAGAGIASGNLIGVFFHHDDDGVLYSEHDSLKGDVYLVDDVLLSVDVGGMFGQWMINYDVESPLVDSDGDGLNNLSEFALGGNPVDPALKGNVPMFGKNGDTFLYVYPRRRNSGLNYWLETATNLVVGPWVAGGYTEFPMFGNIDADFESVTNEFPILGNGAYIRLRVGE